MPIHFNRIERQRRYTTVDDEVLVASLNEDSLVSVDKLGQVRQWEVTYASLASSLGGWKQNFGGDFFTGTLAI